MTHQTYVLSLGGSLIAPSPTGTIDTEYLARFRETLRPFLEEGHRFFLITGGGKTARLYQNALSDLTTATNTELDWIGIYATHLNARLVQMLFSTHAYPDIITHHAQSYPYQNHHQIIVSGGWHPGNSTDYVATCLAAENEVPYVINLSNITYAYTKDPQVYEDAEPIYDMTWTDFQALVGDEWTPGSSLPFDPTASTKAREVGLEVRIMNGENLDNLDHFLRTGEATGTRIHP